MKMRGAGTASAAAYAWSASQKAEAVESLLESVSDDAVVPTMSGGLRLGVLKFLVMRMRRDITNLRREIDDG